MTGVGLRERFEEQGFVHLPGFLADAEAAALREAAGTAADAQDAPNELSLGTMRFASNLYRTSAAVRSAVCSPGLISRVAEVFTGDLWVRWDQAVWKAPGAPTFPWHQDNGYTDLPVPHLQAWFALTPSHPGNGGLLVAPGGHRRRLPHTWEGDHATSGAPDAPTVPVVAETGDLVLFSSLLPHSTGPNTTSATRLAYVAEYLPLDVPDPSVPAPHLVAARGGLPAEEMVDLSARWAPSVPR